MIVQKDEYILTDDYKKIDKDKVCALLSKTYWASNIPNNIIKKSLSKSICFSIFFNDEQVAFARVVTDEAVFSWICDVVVDENHRGKGLGKWLMECITKHKKIKNTKQFLTTKDAHGLYEQYGFVRGELLRKIPDVFK